MIETQLQIIIAQQMEFSDSVCIQHYLQVICFMKMYTYSLDILVVTKELVLSSTLTEDPLSISVPEDTPSSTYEDLLDSNTPELPTLDDHPISSPLEVEVSSALELNGTLISSPLELEDPLVFKLEDTFRPSLLKHRPLCSWRSFHCRRSQFSHLYWRHISISAKQKTDFKWASVRVFS